MGEPFEAGGELGALWKRDGLMGPTRPAIPRILNQVSLFTYVTVPNTPAYRAVLEVFFEARQHYIIELRPREILDAIARDGFQVSIRDEADLESHLGQLVDWGNLTRSHDTAAVSSIEDFYKKRFVYHMTGVGEAAHRAVREVEAAVGKSGSLQAGMLGRIRDALRALAEMAGGDRAPTSEALADRFHDLFAAFNLLVEEANRFIGELNRRLEEGGEESERFELRKQALLIYIDRFVQQLRLLEGEIGTSLDAIATAGVQGMIEAASNAQDLPPGFDEEDPAQTWIREQRAKWDGLRDWFLGHAGRSLPTVSRLASAAVAAVLALTRALGRLNDRHSGRSDRKADFHALAKWFSACPDDRSAHDLWRLAFGLHSARHFHIPEDDPDLHSKGTSWWDATPVEVPVRLRTRGKVSRAGRPSPVPDRGGAKRWIAELRRRERKQLETALARFVGRGSLRMGDLSRLDSAEFDLFLALLDQALSAPRTPEGLRRTRTGDGQLEISLAEPPPEDSTFVTLETPFGHLRCRDFRITVDETSVRRRAQTEQEVETG